LCLILHQPRIVKKIESKNIINQLRWDHADLSIYFFNVYHRLYSVDEKIEIIHSRLHSENDKITNVNEFDRNSVIAQIDSLYKQVVDILNNTAGECIPSVPKNFFKFWWDQELSALKHQAISSHREWVQQGRPKQGYCFDNKMKNKMQYKNAIREKRKSGENSFSNDLHEALLQKTQDNFWKMWKSKFSKRSNIPHEIDGSVSHEEIANKFAVFFAESCKPNSIEKNDQFKIDFIESVKKLKCDYSVKNCVFAEDAVEKAICELKRGKAAGADGLTAEHLQACHPILITSLTKLFDLMLIFEYVPDAFGIGVSIPLPKSLSCHPNSLDDYRCITVSPVISKLFEKCILQKLECFLETSHLQFGFKKRLSCSHAIYSLSSTVGHFVNNQSTVNICSIDVSKAFDRVNHFCLFAKLIRRKVPLIFINMLVCWYSKVVTFVRWVDAISCLVRLTSGVRQGGILSPFLFIVYVDDLLLALENSNLGCRVKGFYVGAFMYADDIILLCPSVTILQEMINLCFCELSYVDLCINFRKSMCLRIGRKFNEFCSQLLICQNSLIWAKQIRYLGLHFIAGRTLKVDLNVAKRKFFISCNSIFSKISSHKADLILPLVSSFGIPVLLYGLESVKLNKSELSRLSHPYTMVFS